MLLRFASKLMISVSTVLMLLAVPAEAQRIGSVFTVSNIHVNTTAADAVQAKQKALAEAKARAFDLLLSRLLEFSAKSSLPPVTPEQIEALSIGLDVRNEGVSGTSYVADVGVTFSQRGVRTLLGQSGLIPITDRGPEILIVPVYIEAGAAQTSDRNPWRKAMGLLDLSHALVPGKVSPTRGDITAAIANAYINAPAPSIETLKKQYNVEFVMLAVAEVPVGADTIEIKIVGQDALGLFTVKRNFKVSDGIDETAMRSAAQLAFDAVQERWKITRAGGPQGGGGQTNPDQPAQAQGGGDAAALEVTAVYNGIKEWQAIRSKLQQLPGVLNWNLKSVNRESAVIGFDFPGGADRLATLGAQQGLAIENGPSGLIVKMR